MESTAEGDIFYEVFIRGGRNLGIRKADEAKKSIPNDRKKSAYSGVYLPDGGLRTNHPSKKGTDKGECI